MAEIKIENVRKVFGKVVAVNDLSLTINDNEFIVLLGPSGCGKTTLLRCIAGLDQVDGGRVYISEKDVTDLPVRQRGISMVFQSYAVFPHMTVFDNISFGLRMQKQPAAEIKKQVQKSAELLHIEDLLDRFPAQLSGGQRQRVAVARAIAYKADVLLMDEPLSNLDAMLRLEMRAELKRLISELHTTVVYVTHDQVEALSLGDRIAVMRRGEFLQVDTPILVYDRPAALFVGSFIGNPPMNYISARIDDSCSSLLIEGSRLPLLDNIRQSLLDSAGKEVWMGIRSENIDSHLSATIGELPARVLVVEPLGSHNLLTVQVGGSLLKVNAHPDAAIIPDQQIWLHIHPEKIRLVDKKTELAFGINPLPS